MKPINRNLIPLAALMLIGACGPSDDGADGSTTNAPGTTMSAPSADSSGSPDALGESMADAERRAREAADEAMADAEREARQAAEKAAADAEREGEAALDEARRQAEAAADDVDVEKMGDDARKQLGDL